MEHDKENAVSVFLFLLSIQHVKKKSISEKSEWTNQVEVDVGVTKLDCFNGLTEKEKLCHSWHFFGNLTICNTVQTSFGR